MVKMLAYDFGASNGRGILGELSGDRLTIEEIHRFPNEPVRFNNHIQWDFLRLCHEVKQGLLKCKENGHKDIKSIGVDTWGVDYGLLDKRGELISSPYCYRDERTEGMIEMCFKSIPKEELFQKTGLQTASYNTIYQLLAMRNSGDDTLDYAETLLLMPDLINYMLTGVKVSEYTICTTSQLYNHRIRGWDRDILKRLNIPEKIFTDIVKPGTIIGSLRSEICSEYGVEPTEVVAVASHDTGSAVAAVPAQGENHVYISCGTWSLLGIESDSPILSSLASKYNFTNEGGINDKIRFLKNIMGLWIVQECRRTWIKEGMKIGFGEMIEEALKVESFKSFIDPDDSAFFAPGNMPERVKQFCKDTEQFVPQTVGQIIRCVEESLAYKYRWAIERVEEMTSKKIDVIHMVGGGIQDQLLCQLTANATGRRVVAGPVEATAIGNLIVQAMALGEIKDIHHGRQIIRNSFEMKEYIPQDEEIWNRNYEQFLKLLK